MRIDIKKTKVYPFAELSDEAKQAALEKLYDVNVDYEWWDCTFDDAANVGIKITEFNIDRGDYIYTCKGDFTLDAEEVANKIIAEHGATCETYKTASEFLKDASAKQIAFENDEDYDPDYEGFCESVEHEEIEAAFKRSILEDYRIMLQHEYDYLASKEAIVETIEANDYEFTADGKLYN